MKKIFKVLGIIFFVIIPVILIIYSMFIDFLGCYIMVNRNNAELQSLLEKEEIDHSTAKIVFVDTTAGDDDHVTIINKNFTIKDKWISNEKSQLVDFVKDNGIDVYNTVTILNYIYIVAIAVIIFFKKLLENVDMFGKFEEKDN